MIVYQFFLNIPKFHLCDDTFIFVFKSKIIFIFFESRTKHSFRKYTNKIKKSKHRRWEGYYLVYITAVYGRQSHVYVAYNYEKIYKQKKKLKYCRNCPNSCAMGTAVVMLTLLHILLASFFGVYTAPDDSNLKRQMI